MSLALALGRAGADANPTLTIFANALRVGEYLVERLGARMNVDASSVVQQSRAHVRLPLESVMAK